jgi:hypothetical protein
LHLFLFCDRQQEAVVPSHAASLEQVNVDMCASSLLFLRLSSLTHQAWFVGFFNVDAESTILVRFTSCFSSSTLRVDSTVSHSSVLLLVQNPCLYCDAEHLLADHLNFGQRGGRRERSTHRTTSRQVSIRWNPCCLHFWLPVVFVLSALCWSPWPID